MNWLNKIGLWIPSEHFREPLARYLQRKFSEHNPRQLLMFDLTHEDLMDKILDKVLSIPVHIEYTLNHRENPSGQFDAETWEITLFGVNEKKYKSDRYLAGYSNYLNSVLFHEYVHAINYIKQLWDRVSYNAMALGKDYYLDPEEVRAYKAMMIDFLQNFLGISPNKVLSLLNRYTTDIDPKRKEYLNLIQNRL